MEAFMEAAKKLAIGKTEAQFRVAASMDKVLMEVRHYYMAKSGDNKCFTSGREALIEVKDGNKTVYCLPEAWLKNYLSLV